MNLAKTPRRHLADIVREGPNGDAAFARVRAYAGTVFAESG
ncbi:hypothetical protein ACFYR1_49210 [Streptomyces canus]